MEKKQRHEQDQTSHHHRSIVNGIKEDPTLSLGPVVESHETFYDTTRPTRGVAISVNDDGDSSHLQVQNVMMNANPGTIYHDELGNSLHDESLDDCSSMSSFSLSVLCSSQSSAGDAAKSLSFTKPLATGTAVPSSSSLIHPTHAVDVVMDEEERGVDMVVVHDLQRQVESLQNENYKLQEEVELLRADKALLSPTKYQVELDSMRLVAEQIQKESEEKIQVLEQENKRLNDDMDRLQHTLQMQQQMNQHHEETESVHPGDIWKHFCCTLLEQICLLEESGLRIDPSLRMDHVLRDVISGIHVGQVRGLGASKSSSMSSLVESLGMDRYMERLAKGCGGGHVMDSTKAMNGNDRNDNVVVNPSMSQNTTVNHSINGKYSQGTDSIDKYVSVGVDTEDLMSMGLLSPGSFITSRMNGSMYLQQTISELQLENASLKGSNEHMRGQLHRYRQEIQTLRESLSKSTSSVSAMAEKHRMHSDSMNQHVLEQQNAELLQEIRILSENQRVVEEENRRVVQRCVELEAVAEDATDECEELVARLAEMERELKEVRDERDNLLISHEDYENATTERENENQKLRDEMSWKYQSLESKCNHLMEAKSELEKEMEKMHTLKTNLDSELDVMRDTIADKNSQISSLEAHLAQLQERLSNEENKVLEFSKETKVLKEENKDLHDQQESLRKRQHGVADLEDECSRLRNLNGMIKAKLEITNAELNKVKTQNASLIQQLASLRSECDAMRIENVALSDNKTDMEMEMRKYEKECEDQKNLISKIEKELGKVITIRDELQKQNSSLRNQLQDCENAKNAVENNLEAQKTENQALRVQMNTYGTIVLKAPESSEKRVTNNIRQNSPHAYMATPVGVQTPDTIQSGAVTPAIWSAKSMGPTSGQNTNTDPMDDQLQRIQAAKEKAAVILKNISNFRIKQGTSTKAEEPISFATNNVITEKEKKENSLKKTEAFVHSILDSCGKQTPSI